MGLSSAAVLQTFLAGWLVSDGPNPHFWDAYKKWGLCAGSAMHIHTHWQTQKHTYTHFAFRPHPHLHHWTQNRLCCLCIVCRIWAYMGGNTDTHTHTQRERKREREAFTHTRETNPRRDPELCTTAFSPLTSPTWCFSVFLLVVAQRTSGKEGKNERGVQFVCVVINACFFLNSVRELRKKEKRR